MENLNIPKSFQLFGTTVEVVWDNKRMNDLNSYGLYEYTKNRITLSDLDGVELLSEDRMKDCFYHESVHAILEAMCERDLSKNEKFVDTFAKLMRQMNETKQY